VAGPLSITSHTLSNDPCQRPQKENARRHGNRTDWTVKQCMYAQLIFFNNIITPTPFGLTSHLPDGCHTTSRTSRPLYRPMGAAGCQGLQAGTAPDSEVPTTNSGNQGKSNPGGRRSAEAARQRGNKGCQPMPQPVCQQNICDPKKDGSFRPVINLRQLNRFMITKHFKMEGLAMLKDLLRLEDWMASIDLKDAYLLVTIWEGHWQYLHFVWNSQLYEFQCLPFGLCNASRVFTKLLKPVLARVHHQGLWLVMYLDDMLVMAQMREELEGHLLQITSLLECLGFVVNQEKFQLTLS